MYFAVSKRLLVSWNDRFKTILHGVPDHADECQHQGKKC